MNLKVDQKPLSKSDVILIADDEIFTRFITAEILNQLGGPETLVAKDGLAAINALTDDGAERISMVLLDMNMPCQNGLQVLKKIRSGGTRARHDLPVIVISGIDDWKVITTAIRLDADGFLKKPIDFEALKRNIEDIKDIQQLMSPPEFYTEIEIDGIEMLPLVTKTLDIKDIVTIHIDDVAEGQIIAKDVITPKGDTLIAVGTDVSPRLIRVLHSLVSAGLPVEEVCVAISRELQV